MRSCLYFAFKIKDGLFIGDINSPNERDFLVSNKITCVVNCAASQIKPINLNLGIKFISFDWLDNDDQVNTIIQFIQDDLSEKETIINQQTKRQDYKKIQKQYEQIKDKNKILNKNIIIDDNSQNMQLIYEFMNRAYENCESVLVCSVRGQSRALTVITAFLMKRYQWSLYKTLEYMNSKRADFEIRATFLKQLLSHEQKLFGAKGCSRNWKDEVHHSDQEGSLVRNTYVNSQLICIESRDFYMRSIASRDYATYVQRNTKLKWSSQLKLEIPHEELVNISKKQSANPNNINPQNVNQNGNNVNVNGNNTSSNQSMKNSSNWTASNSSNQMDSVEILPIQENTFQAPKKSILKTLSAYEKKNNQPNQQTSTSSDESNNIQNTLNKKKDSKKPPIQKNQSYDLIEEQNEEYEQSSSEIFINKAQLRNPSLPPSPARILKPLNDLEKELLIKQSNNSNSSQQDSAEGQQLNSEQDSIHKKESIESDSLSDKIDQFINRQSQIPQTEILSQNQQLKQQQQQQSNVQSNEIKIFETNINKNKLSNQTPTGNISASIQNQEFQIQKEKKKNNYFIEESNQLETNPMTALPPKNTNPLPPNSIDIKSSNNFNNHNLTTDDVRVIAVEENDNNENGYSEPYRQNYQQGNNDNQDRKNIQGNNRGGYQILNDQQIKNSINLSQYQIQQSRQQQQNVGVSQPGSNNSSRQTTPTRKYRKSPFPMALPQRKIIQSQTAPNSNQNSRKSSLSSIDQLISQYPQHFQQQNPDNNKKQHSKQPSVNKSPDSSQLHVNINLNINSVNILNQTTNPIYQRQKSPTDNNESQNINIIQSNQSGKSGRKVQICRVPVAPSQDITKKRPTTDKVYTEVKPSSTRITRRLQTYTNGDPLTFLPNITFMRSRTPLKNNINLPNTQFNQQQQPIQSNSKQPKNLELSFQDISPTPNSNFNNMNINGSNSTSNNNNNILNNNPNSQQLYTNYLNDVDISSQQNTSKSSSTNKPKGFKRDYTPLLRAKLSMPSPYQNHENRSNSTVDQRRISTESSGGQGRSSDLGKHKRSGSRGKDNKELNNTFTYLNTPNNNNNNNNITYNNYNINNNIINTPNGDINLTNQVYSKFNKPTFKPSYNKLLY